jgi:acyl-CoA thioesterase FadM
MNNAAYLTHCELARWELVATNGMLSYALEHKVLFMVGSAHIRYRRGIPPFGKFEISTSVASFDDNSMVMKQVFHPVGKQAEPTSSYATAMFRAVLKRGKESVVPREVFAAIGLPEVELAGLDTADRLVVDTFEALDAAVQAATRQAPPPPPKTVS